VDFAVLPLLFAVFKFRKSVVPVLAAIGFSLALPLSLIHIFWW